MLYNVDPPGPLNTYDDPEVVPPRNDPENIVDEVVPRIDGDTPLRCEWHARGVDLYNGDALIASFENGEKPGRSRFVRDDCRLARRLER